MVTFIICYTIFKQHIHVGNTFIMCYTIPKQHICCVVFVVPDVYLFKNPTKYLYVFGSTPWHISMPDMMSNLTVYNGIFWRSYLQTLSCFNCVITERLTVTVNSKSWQHTVAGSTSITAYDHPVALHLGPLRETRHVWGNSLLQIPMDLNYKDPQSRVLNCCWK